jgi:hypothetical protein
MIPTFEPIPHNENTPRIYRLRKCRPSGALNSPQYIFDYQNAVLTGLISDHSELSGTKPHRDDILLEERLYFGGTKPCRGDILFMNHG